MAELETQPSIAISLIWLTIGSLLPRTNHIRDFDPQELAKRPIQTGNHCYGCTAGAGSSCTGTTTG